MDEPAKSEMAAQAVSVCLCFHTRKAARAITQVFDHALAGTGLKANQLNLLMVVNDRGATTIGQLAAAMATDSTTVSRNIKPLIADGLIIQTANPSDKRVKRLSLSEDGIAALELALPAWQEAQTKVARELGSVQVQSLLPGLDAASKLGPGRYG